MSQQLLQPVIVASYFSRRVPAISTRQKPGSHLFEVVSKRQDQVKSLYRIWAEANQGIFFVENEEVGSSPVASGKSISTNLQEIADGPCIAGDPVRMLLPLQKLMRQLLVLE